MSTFSDKAKQILGTVAPILGTAIGGPFGALAGAALSKILGVSADDPKATEAALLTASPETLAAIKKADEDFQVQMKSLGITEEKLTFDDISNARAREVAVKDTTPRNLAYLILCFTGACIGATLLGVTKVDSALAGTLIGYLVSECKSTLTYYFGSSQGSRDKDAALADIAKQP